MKLEAPNVKLSLEYVYGYRAYDMRNNIYVNSNGCIVYNQAQMAVNLKAETNSQRFFMQSSNEIIAIDSFGDLSASGEIA